MSSDIFILREKYKGSLEFNFDFVCVDKLGKNLNLYPAAIVLGGRQKSDTFYIMRGNIEYDL